MAPFRKDVWAEPDPERRGTDLLHEAFRLAGTLRPSVGEATIARFEAAHGIRIASDHRAFLLDNDGTYVRGTSGDLNGIVCFWPLRCWKVHAPSGLAVFADHMQECYHYGTGVDERRPSFGKILRIEPFCELFGTFDDFARAVASDSMSLYELGPALDDSSLDGFVYGYESAEFDSRANAPEV